MNILGLMLKAVRGTVEDQVQRALEGFGQSEPAPEPAAEARKPGGPEARPPAEEPVPSFEVVDALFPGGAREPEAAAASAEARPAPPLQSTEQAPKATGGSAAAPPEQAPQQAVSPEARPREPGATEPSAAEAKAQAEQDARAVLSLLERRGTPLKGYGIAEETGIAPWWRLKDVLQRLTREGKVEQTEDGLFVLRTDRDRTS